MKKNQYLCPQKTTNTTFINFINFIKNKKDLMKKRLLLGFMAACMAAPGFALSQGEFVYTPQGRFQITDANVASSNFATLDGWTVVSAAGNTIDANFLIKDGAGPNGLSSAMSANATAGEGMYYKFTPASASNTYVVSYKMKGAPAVSTRIKTVDVQTNLVKVEGLMSGVYGQATEAGEGEVTDVIANTAEELSADWQTFSYAIVGDGTERTYFISFTGMATDIEIADLQIAPAVQVADLRQRDAMVEKLNAYINAYEWGDDLLGEWGMTETLEGLSEVGDETGQDELNGLLEGAEETLAEFLKENMDDYLGGNADNYLGIKTTSGNTQKVNNIGEWTCIPGGRGHWMSGSYPDMGHFQNSATWCNGAPDAPMGVSMQKKLEAGSYVFGIESNAALREPLKNTWNNDDGLKPAYGVAYIVKMVDGEATDTIKSVVKDLHPVNYTPFIVSAQVEEDGTYEIGFKAYCKDTHKDLKLGSVVYVKDATLYGKNDNIYSQAQLAYYDDVMEQITTGRTNITTAKTNIADATLYWGKAVLQDTINTYEPVIATYEAMSQDDIIATYQGYYEKTTSNDNGLMVYEVYQAAVKQLIAANRVFTAVNDTLNSLATAIASAEETLGMRVYDAATGKAALQTAIDAAKGVLAQMQATDYSEENAATIVATIATLDEAVATFKTTAPAGVTIVDIDFEKAATLNAETGLYSISGTAGTMEFSTFSTQEAPVENSFEQGIWSNGEHLYAGYLRVGNGTGTVTFDPTDNGSMGTNILKVSYDFYLQGLSGRNVGVYLKANAETEDGSATTKDVAAFYANYYDNTITDNTFGIELGSLQYASGSNYNDAAPEGAEGAGNYVCAKNSFEFIFDFGEKSMYCTTTSAKGVKSTKKLEFDGTIPTSFVLQSNYNVASRRIWIDNLKIERIAAGSTDGFTDGVKEVATPEQTVAPVRKEIKNGRIVINGKYGLNGMLIK